MKYIRLLITITITTFLFSTSYASNDNDHATTPSSNHSAKVARANEILVQAMSGDGIMNATIHKEFWRYMPERSRDLKDPLMVKMRQFVNNSSPAYQKELLSCAMQSYQKRTVVKTELLIQLRDSAKQQALNAYESKNGTPAYDSFLKAIDRGIKDSENLLIASSKHSVWNNSILGPIPISMEYLIEHKKNIDESLERVNILLDPTYYDNK